MLLQGRPYVDLGGQYLDERRKGRLLKGSSAENVQPPEWSLTLVTQADSGDNGG